MGYMWQQHKRVIGLELGRLQLGGVISPSIGNLSFLISLDLSNNSFGGTIPQEVGKLFRLEYLYMSSNVLRRGMPTSLSNCSRLLDLYLYTNPLGGGVPSELGSIPTTRANILTLQELRMEFNSLTGSIPPSFGKQQNMQTLALRANYFGSYSDGDLRFFNALSNGMHLLSLSVGSNRLGGDLPSSIANMSTNLTELSPGGNHISGSVPRDIRNLIHLQTSQLYGNLLSECPEKIPSSIGNITQLVKLYLSNNSFEGVIPPSLDIRGLVGLKRVDLSNNISGSIPGYFSSFPLLEYLNQSNNNFEGRVPTKAKFQNSSLVSVSGNNNLCGDIKDLKLKPCFEIAPPMDTERPSLLKKVVIGLKIVIDVASVLDYLHVQCLEPIAHCDLKPNNILLDDDFIAHVSDFGLARLLLKFDEEYILNQLTSAGVRGTIGYATPGKPSIHGDRCSFGVLLLEMFTGKRPTSELFEGNYTLHSYTKSALPDPTIGHRRQINAS
uniref:Protein kinase domain-containing protein n=1 Tax=Brassica campestris TaxID=3711 RepID=M4DPP7_BRACM